MSYVLCDSCTVVVVNGDTSHLDDFDCNWITNRIDAMGLLALDSVYDPSGYWECEACSETCIGTGNVFSTV